MDLFENARFKTMAMANTAVWVSHLPANSPGFGLRSLGNRLERQSGSTRTLVVQFFKDLLNGGIFETQVWQLYPKTVITVTGIIVFGGIALTVGLKTALVTGTAVVGAMTAHIPPGRQNFWPGHMPVADAQVIDLGLATEKGWFINEVFPQFSDAPFETRLLLIDRLQHLRRLPNELE